MVKPDGTTITANTGTLSVNTQQFPKASATQFGVIKTSNEITSNNGIVSMKDYDIISSKVSSMLALINSAANDISELEETIASL